MGCNIVYYSVAVFIPSLNCQGQPSGHFNRNNPDVCWIEGFRFKAQLLLVICVCVCVWCSACFASSPLLTGRLVCTSALEVAMHTYVL